MIHTVATIAMLIVGLTLVVMYFTVTDAAKDRIKPDAAGAKGGKNQRTFDSAMAGILSLGSMFIAFSLSVLAIENSIKDFGSVGEKLGGSYSRYMFFMLLVGIIVIALGSVALSLLQTGDDSKNAKNQLIGLISVASVATLVALGFGISSMRSSAFGFDFEF